MVSRARKLTGRFSGAGPDVEAVLKLFREWGRQGGAKRAKALSPEARRGIARKAARARWKRAKG